MTELSKENIGQHSDPKIHAYVINLQKAFRRWENMRADLDALDIPYTRIEAVHGDDLTLPIDEYNERKFNILTGKAANKRMVGCYLSHINALRKFLKSDQPYALILEDDAILPEQTTSLLAAILEHKADWDMVRLSSEREGHYLPFASLPHGFELAYNTRVLKNTAAYLVNRHAAQCCVDKMLPMCLPYDIALDREWDFGFRTACVTPFPVKLKADEPSQIPRAKRIRLFRATTFHVFHYLTHFERRFHRTRTFRKQKGRRPMNLSEADHPNVTVRKISHKGRGAKQGRGVFSQKKFRPGDLVIAGKPVGDPTARNWATVQVEVDIHIIPDEPFLCSNHSCEPTCGLRPNGHGAYDLIAIRDIAIGEEVTWDYCMSEWEMVGFSTCHCGSAGCRETIRGAKHLPETFFEQHSGFLAPYYKNLRNE